MKLPCLAVLIALPVFAHTPPLERLPAVVAAQVETATTGELNRAVVDETHTESVVLKIVGASLSLLSPLLVALVAFGAAYLNAKKKELEASGGRADGLHALAIGADLVHTYVARAEVEIRPMLQKALADGVLSQAEGAELKAKVIELVKRDMPANVMAALSNALGPAVEGWLSGKVEQAVTAQRAASNAPAPSPT